jgi:hypothetical protein
MKRSCIIVWVLIAIVLSGSIFAEGDKVPEDNSKKLVWFDGFGAYHYDDPVDYFNKVLSGELKDPEAQMLLSTFCKDIQKVSSKDVLKIAAELDPLKHTLAIYYPDKKLTEKHRTIIVDHFGDKSSITAAINIKSFAFQIQGPVSQVKGANDINLLLAVPADPEVMKRATNLIVDDDLSLQKELLVAAKSPDWSQHAQISKIGEGGISYLLNLSPGPWIIYMNQRNLIIQCYRFIVKSDTQNDLIAEKISAPPMGKLVFGDAK